MKYIFCRFKKLKIYILLIGFLSLIWLIIRTGRKPSRINYPCQKIAINNSLLFLSYIIGFLGIKISKKLLTKNIRLFYYTFMLTIIIVISGTIGLVYKTIYPSTAKADSHSHEPIGNGTSKVIWVHDNDASSAVSDYTNWRTGQSNGISQETIDNMMDQGILSLTNRSTIRDAWVNLLELINSSEIPGKKIAIKVNFNNPVDHFNSLPHTIKSLLDQLTLVGFNEVDIYIYDVSRTIWPSFKDYLINTGYTNVNFVDKDNIGSFGGWAAIGYLIDPDVTSGNCRSSFYASKPELLNTVDYLINIPIYRGHGGAQITFGFKNHYGSLPYAAPYSQPAGGGPEFHDGSNRTGAGGVSECWSWDDNLPSSMDDLNANHPLVQLSNDNSIKDKTILVIGDGIFSHYTNNYVAVPDHNPNSLWLSKDPVALDSALFDFLKQARGGDGGSLQSMWQAYLHIAGRKGLGVHAHATSWNSGVPIYSSGINFLSCENSICPVQAITDDLIFIHHSCGSNWLSNSLHQALIDKDYIDERNDITYGIDVNPNNGRSDSLGQTPGDNTNMNHWIRWFNDYLESIKVLGAATGVNKIIMYKSCYPISNITADGSEPGDPFSSSQTITNYKAVYRHPNGSGNTYSNGGYTYKPLEDIFAENTDTLFIVITAPPRNYVGSSDSEAHRARIFNNWLKTEWLTNYNTTHPDYNNVAVFDWFDILAYPDDHLLHPNRLKEEYGGSTGDSHPNSTANSYSTQVFTTNEPNFLDNSWNSFVNGLTYYNLAVTKTGNGSGTVTSSPAGINCGSTCSYSFNSGTSIVLTANPAASSNFTSWSGGGCSSSGLCNVTMNESISVTATFTLKIYTISAFAGSGGSINPNGNITVNYDADQSFIITAENSYEILDVLVDSVSQGPISSYTFQSVTQNHSITALFQANSDYQSICESNNGRWLEQYNECEGISESLCTSNDGFYNSCGSSCRHNSLNGQRRNMSSAGCVQHCISFCTFGGQGQVLTAESEQSQSSPFNVISDLKEETTQSTDKSEGNIDTVSISQYIGFENKMPSDYIFVPKPILIYDQYDPKLLLYISIVLLSISTIYFTNYYIKVRK